MSIKELIAERSRIMEEGEKQPNAMKMVQALADLANKAVYITKLKEGDDWVTVKEVLDLLASKVDRTKLSLYQLRLYNVACELLEMIDQPQG